MPPKMGLRVRSCFHNAFSAVDCQEISGRFWPVAGVDEERESANRELFCGGLAALRLGLELSTKLGATHFF